MREGNLEAPTRHPIDWKNPDFVDETKALAEMERVFDICHGCRRCVSLCQSFPTLFDLVDATADGEVHGIEKQAYGSVVDQCYLCDLCCMTKCPYTPPHPWMLDFPHPMLRAKAIKHGKGEVAAKEKFLASTDTHGQFAGIPIVVDVVNAVSRTRGMRKALQTSLGVHADAWLPGLAEQRFRWSRAMNNLTHVAVNGQRTPGKAAIFATCYVNHNEPGIGGDLVKLLDHNAIPYEIVEKEQCCGMPKLELGDLPSVERAWLANMAGAGEVRESRLRDHHRHPELHVDVQAGTALDVFRRCRHTAGQARAVRPLRILHRAPQGRPAEDRLQGRARQGQPPHPTPTGSAATARWPATTWRRAWRRAARRPRHWRTR